MSPTTVSRCKTNVTHFSSLPTLAGKRKTCYKNMKITLFYNIFTFNFLTILKTVLYNSKLLNLLYRVHACLEALRFIDEIENKN